MVGSKGTPDRSLNTMSDVIALGSPSGSMSNRSRKIAQERLRVELFGKEGLAFPKAIQPTEAEVLLRRAKELRDLAARGMHKRKYIKQAEVWEKQASLLKDNPMKKRIHGKFYAPAKGRYVHEAMDNPKSPTPAQHELTMAKLRMRSSDPVEVMKAKIVLATVYGAKRAQIMINKAQGRRNPVPSSMKRIITCPHCTKRVDVSAGQIPEHKNAILGGPCKASGDFINMPPSKRNPVPSNMKVRSKKTASGHVIRFKIPKGARKKGSAEVMSILHPKSEKPAKISSYRAGDDLWPYKNPKKMSGGTKLFLVGAAAVLAWAMFMRRKS